MVAVDHLRTRRPLARKRDVTAREHARARDVAAACAAALEECDAGLLLVDRSGGVVYASGRADDLLAAYGDALSRIAGWPAPGPGGAMLVAGPRGRLRVRSLPGEAWAPCRALVLDEQRTRAPALASLVGLGLTRREAEVLRLVCCGQANDQIALELAISSRTVGKHLERTYVKLGVGSRAAAIARTLGLAAR